MPDYLCDLLLRTATHLHAMESDHWMLAQELDRAAMARAKELAEADMLPDALMPVADEWYKQICERAGYADRITISGDLAVAIKAAVGGRPPAAPAEKAVAWDKSRYGYTLLWNAIGAACTWQEGHAIGISIEAFEDYMIEHGPKAHPNRAEVVPVASKLAELPESAHYGRLGSRGAMVRVPYYSADQMHEYAQSVIDAYIREVVPGGKTRANGEDVLRAGAPVPETNDHRTAIIISVSREGDSPLGIDIERIALQHWLAAGAQMASKDWPPQIRAESPAQGGCSAFTYAVEARLIHGTRESDVALHTAVVQAVALLNRSAAGAACNDARLAGEILRRALFTGDAK